MLEKSGRRSYDQAKIMPDDPAQELYAGPQSLRRTPVNGLTVASTRDENRIEVIADTLTAALLEQLNHGVPVNPGELITCCVNAAQIPGIGIQDVDFVRSPQVMEDMSGRGLLANTFLPHRNITAPPAKVMQGYIGDYNRIRTGYHLRAGVLTDTLTFVVPRRLSDNLPNGNNVKSCRIIETTPDTLHIAVQMAR